MGQATRLNILVDAVLAIEALPESRILITGSLVRVSLVTQRRFCLLSQPLARSIASVWINQS